MNIERWNRLLASLGAEADPETFEKLRTAYPAFMCISLADGGKREDQAGNTCSTPHMLCACPGNVQMNG